jgi:hypothetical protein
MYSLYAPTWTARKLDKKATEDVKKMNGVDSGTDAGNYNKLLLPDCAELKALSSYIAAGRNAFYLRTAPWAEARGVRVGLAENHMDLMSWFGDLQHGMGPLKSAFGAVYPAEIEKSIFLLHGMGDRSEYPGWHVVERRFDLQLSVQPLPNKNDIRVLTEIPKHVREEIESNLQKEFENVQSLAVRNALEPLLKKLAHMGAHLRAYTSGEAKKIYDSLTENVTAMAEAAKRLNIARDTVVDQLADEALRLVAGVTSEDLKTSDGMRDTKAKAAEELAAKMAQFFK